MKSEILNGLLGLVIMIGTPIAAVAGKKVADKLKTLGQKNFIMAWFLRAQKVLPGATGDERFEWALAQMKRFNPDYLDPALEAFARSVYVEYTETTTDAQ